MRTLEHITTNTHPQDYKEGHYATLHYHIEELEQEQELTYKSIRLSLDDAPLETSLQTLKSEYAKEARSFELGLSTVNAQLKDGEAPLNADEKSINRLGHIKLIALYSMLEAYALNDEKFQEVWEQAHKEEIPFKCADETVRELSLKTLSHAHKQSFKHLSSLYATKEQVQEQSKQNTEETQQQNKES